MNLDGFKSLITAWPVSQTLFALIWIPIATDLSTVKDIVKKIDMCWQPIDWPLFHQFLGPRTCTMNNEKMVSILNQSWPQITQIMSNCTQYFDIWHFYVQCAPGARLMCTGSCTCLFNISANTAQAGSKVKEIDLTNK